MKYTFDSREVRPGDVFVALKGEKADGHDFIDRAKAAGAVDVVDGLEDLQARAKAKRRAMKAKVVGVTGSAGKTTTKELLKAFLACAGRTYGTEGNFNNHIGLPLTILNAPDDVAFLVLEMGSNHPGEIAALCEIAGPDVGVVTGVGTAHLEHFGTRAGIAEEKGTLLAVAGDFGVFPAADDFAEALGARCIRPVAAQPAVDGLLDPTRAWPPHFAGNAALAYEVASRFGVTVRQAADTLADFALPGARWRKVEKDGVTFIDDTYNANPDSMIAALDALAAMPWSGRRVAVLGDMFELGPDAVAYHEKVFAHALSLGLQLVVGIGEMSSRCPCHCACRELAEFRSRFRLEIVPGDLVLLKASHGMRLGDLLV